MRAQYLYEVFETRNFGNNVCAIMDKIMKNNPTYYNTYKCNNCKLCVKKNFSTVSVSSEHFHDDFSNLEQSILNNILEVSRCTKCSKTWRNELEFSHHMFVEVCEAYLYFFDLF